MMAMKTFAFTLLFLIAFSINAQENLLGGKYTAAELEERLVPRNKWKPFPPVSDRNAWAKADTAAMNIYRKYAEDNLEYDWPTVPATLSLMYARNGNRSKYQVVSYKKRTVLANMILAEIYENNGRFIDPIVNGIWSICEESWWGSSAHLPQTSEYAGLADVSKPFVDLYSAVTAGILAWADYFLGDNFDEISPQIRKRIRHEVNGRILIPLQGYHDWMGKNGKTSTGRPPNNWNPWICSNWLTCTLLLEDDQRKRAETVGAILKVLDEFLNPYPDDGGCTEGPSYWGAAMGALYNNLALLNLASGNAFDYVFANEKFRNGCRYIYNVQIDGEYFVNFADAGPRIGLAGNTLYRIAKDTGDDAMMDFASTWGRPKYADYVRSHFATDFFDLFLEEIPRKRAPLPENVWMPVTEVAVARDRHGDSSGFFFAAKGGHNDESHNHNDVGNFIVYHNGEPILIDVGAPRYTSMTFSSRRYEIWNLCSDYHNLPTINGINQKNGSEYKSANASFKADRKASSFSLDIAPAYPPEAQIRKWMRSVTLERNRRIVIRDEAELGRADSIVWHFMTACPVTLSAPGILSFSVGEGKETLSLLFDAGAIEASIEKIPLTTESDEQILMNWGDNIRRINLTAKNTGKTIKYKFIIQKK
jgi:hypothetical protein